MDNAGFMDIIIFAAIAAFLVYRLRIVLGRKDFSDNIKENNFSRMKGGLADKLKKPAVAVVTPEKPAPVQAQSKDMPPEPEITDPAILAGFEEIKKFDKNFTAGYFLTGAKAAFEMILEAFAKGNLETVNSLLTPEVQEAFSQEIAARSSEPGKKHETTLVAINSGEITKARVEGKTAHIGMRFMSEQIDITRNDKGEIIAGDPSHIILVQDEWTFSRDMTSGNPNWKLTGITG